MTTGGPGSAKKVNIMKPNQEPEGEEGLDRVLRQWTLEAPLPARFQEQVWRRIAREETQPRLTFRAGLLRRVEAVLLRPKIALSYVATVLVLGVAAGGVAAQIKTSHLDASLRARYVQSVNPYPVEASQP
jgi:hypothetical protein